MSFIKYSPEYILDSSTSIENIYISEYLPSIPDHINKVYIFGLFLCNNETLDNSLASMSARLQLEEEVIRSCYDYLQALGLVQILNKNNFEVRYLPIKDAKPIRKYNAAKYADFNIQMQEIISGRMIGTREFSEYYDLIELAHFEPEVVLMIARYATSLKGDNINYPYILAVARNWASEGVLTVQKADEKLLEYDSTTEKILQLFKIMGIKRAADWDDRELYIKWTMRMEFPHESVAFAAKTCKKGGMQKLDGKLSRFYEAKLVSVKDIQNYEDTLDNLYSIAKNVNRTIGVYYEQLDNVVDTYITVWLNMGFDENTLIFIANICFKRGIKTLEGLNEQVNKFYKQGIVTESAIDSYLNRLSSGDALIREVLAACGSDQPITTRLRDTYRTWTYSWCFPQDVVVYCAQKSAGTAQPVAYINKVLSDWNARNIKTLEAAKMQSLASSAAVQPQSTVKREYTQSELNALIDDIDDIKF